MEGREGWRGAGRGVTETGREGWGRGEVFAAENAHIPFILSL